MDSDKKNDLLNYKKDCLDKLDLKHNDPKKAILDEKIQNLTSQDYIILASMHQTYLKTMTKIHPLELVESCEKLFDCGLMQKMDRDPPLQLGIKVQNWLNSVEYSQYTKNIHRLLTVEQKEKIRQIYAKLQLNSHDLSELTKKGIELLDAKKSELSKHWKTLFDYNETRDKTNLKKSMDEFAESIPMMLVMSIANGNALTSMFSTMGIGMYGYLSDNPLVDPIFLEFLTPSNIE